MDENSIFEAAFNNDSQRITELVSLGVDANNVHSKSGHTPLQVACEANSLEAIVALLECGADPNKKFTKVSRIDGRVICSESVALMHVLSVQAAATLLKFGANPSIRDGDGRSAIDWAIFDKNDDLVVFLKSIQENGNP